MRPEPVRRFGIFFPRKTFLHVVQFLKNSAACGKDREGKEKYCAESLIDGRFRIGARTKRYQKADDRHEIQKSGHYDLLIGNGCAITLLVWLR